MEFSTRTLKRTMTTLKKRVLTWTLALGTLITSSSWMINRLLKYSFKTAPSVLSTLSMSQMKVLANLSMSALMFGKTVPMDGTQMNAMLQRMDIIIDFGTLRL